MAMIFNLILKYLLTNMAYGIVFMIQFNLFRMEIKMSITHRPFF